MRNSFFNRVNRKCQTEVETFIKQIRIADNISTYLLNNKEAELGYMELSKSRYACLLANLKHVAAQYRSSTESCKLLDIGPTPFTILLGQKLSNVRISVLDRTDYLSDRFTGAGIELHQGRLGDEPIPFKDESFDIIVLAEVLEHIFAAPTTVLTEITRTLRPGGTLVITVPNIAQLAKRIKLLFGISPLENADTQMRRDWSHGHIHEYTRKELMTLCEGIGLEIVYIEMQSETPMEVIRRKGRLSLKALLIACAVWLLPPLKTNIHIECVKPDTRCSG